MTTKITTETTIGMPPTPEKWTYEGNIEGIEDWLKVFERLLKANGFEFKGSLTIEEQE